jgi:type II secretory pathway pseudopilin PulG
VKSRSVILKSKIQGSLLIELLVVVLLISLFLPFLVTALGRLQERHLLAQTYQDQHKFKAAIDAHFTAQWARLIPANCSDNGALFLTIKSGSSKPDRLSSRTVMPDSDWLQGVDYGVCRTSMTVSENPFGMPLDCHWQAGDSVTFSNCIASFSGQVLSVTSAKSTIQLEADFILDQSGVIESQDGFFWYLSPGKDGGTAFWRTPEESGNSLELLNGIERFSVFPLLDKDDNGSVETLVTDYGNFSLKSVRGLWVEYQYRLDDCHSERGVQLDQEYFSMRGETWRYGSPCQGVGNHIVVLKGGALK